MADSFSIAQTVDLPLAEISGLCVRSLPGSALELCAIGDDSTFVVRARIERGRVLPGPARTDVAALVAADDRGQWEAIAADASGRLFVLQENPGRVFVFSRALDALEHTLELCVDEGLVPGLAASWSDDENSRGEGLVLLTNGHLLVVKEKSPPLLVEFGPRGAHAMGVRPDLLSQGTFPLVGSRIDYVPLQAWTFDREALEDLSDIAVGGDGSVFLISDQERCLIEIDPNLSSAGGDVRVIDRRKLPKRVKKPEGLAILEGRIPVVAIDRDDEEQNLFVLLPGG